MHLCGRWDGAMCSELRTLNILVENQRTECVRSGSAMEVEKETTEVNGLTEEMKLFCYLGNILD